MPDAIRTVFVLCGSTLVVCAVLYAATYLKPESDARKRRRQQLRLVARDRRRFWCPDDEDGGRAA